MTSYKKIKNVIVTPIVQKGQDLRTMFSEKEKEKQALLKDIYKIVSSYGESASKIIHNNPGSFTGKQSVNSDTGISIDSSLNYKNYELRKFLDLKHARTSNKYSMDNASPTSPSFHGVYENGQDVLHTDTSGNLVVKTIKDNFFVSHGIPSTLYGFRWMKERSTATTVSGSVFRPSGNLYSEEKNNNIKSNIIFPTSSDTNFVGLNDTYYEPVSLLSLRTGPEPLREPNLAGTELSSYNNNKRSITSSLKGTNHWTYHNKPLVRNLIKNNLYAYTAAGSPELFREPVVTNNNLIHYMIKGENCDYSVATTFGDILSNPSLSSKIKGRLHSKEANFSNVRELTAAVSRSALEPYAKVYESSLYPKKNNQTLRSTTHRINFSDTGLAKSLSPKDLKLFWSTDVSHRARPHLSSNSLDYKNDLYYDIESGIIDSINPLDNNSYLGKRLVGELAYLGEEIYNSYTNDNSLKSSVLSDSSNTSLFLRTYSPVLTKAYNSNIFDDSESGQGLRLLNNIESSSNPEFIDNRYWGTSLNLYDFSLSPEYYLGSVLSKNITHINSLDVTSESLLSKGVLLENKKLNSTPTMAFLYNDSDFTTSAVNNKVAHSAFTQDLSVRPDRLQIKNRTFCRTHRPQPQLFYYPNQQGTPNESGFVWEKGSLNYPSYDSYNDYTFNVSNGITRGILPEFRITPNLDSYYSSEEKFEKKNHSIFEILGSGDTNDLYSSHTSAEKIVTSKKVYFKDESALSALTKYPEEDNNFAWYKINNTDNNSFNYSTFRNHNLITVPADSTFSLENSINTEYNISNTRGYNGINTSGNTWISVPLNRNAAAVFNVEHSNDYISLNISKPSTASTNDYLDLTSDSFSLSLWLSPDKRFYASTPSMGLLSLTQDDPTGSESFLSLYIKNDQQKMSLHTHGVVYEMFKDSSATTPVAPSLEYIENLIFKYDHQNLQYSAYFNAEQVYFREENTSSTPSTTITITTLQSTQHRIERIEFGRSTSQGNKLYHGILDEISLWSGIISQNDATKYFHSNGAPTNILEFYANGEMSSGLYPIHYNRVGYPYNNTVTSNPVIHNQKFVDKYMISDSVDLSSFISSEPSYSKPKVRLKVHGSKKMLPYNGLYPYQKILNISSLFNRAYKNQIVVNNDTVDYSQQMQSMLQPFFSPGVLFNSVKSGLSSPWPIYSNVSGLEPTRAFDKIQVLNNESLPVEYYNNAVAPSWYYLEDINISERKFLNEIPLSHKEYLENDAVKELINSQPRFTSPMVNGRTVRSRFSNDSGLIINRVANSYIDLGSLERESIFENITKSEEQQTQNVYAYQHCVLEFNPNSISSGTGFSLQFPLLGVLETLNIVFNIVSSTKGTKGYSISNVNEGSNEIQITIGSDDLTIKLLQEAISDLFNNRLQEHSFRVIQLDRNNNKIINPEPKYLDLVDLPAIDTSLQTQENRLRLAFIYIGTLSPDSNTRKFVSYDNVNVSTFSEPANGLGIRYYDRFGIAPTKAEEGSNTNTVLIGQYNKEFYKGKKRKITISSGNVILSTGAKQKANQFYMLAGDRYTGSIDNIIQDKLWPSFEWNQTLSDKNFQRSLYNFTRETQNFFLKNDKTLRYIAPDIDREITTSVGKTYTMEVYMYKTPGFETVKNIADNTGKYYGPPYRYHSDEFYKKEQDLTNDFAYAPFAPAYHYGETAALISYTADKEKTTIKEISENIRIEYINKEMEKRYEKEFGSNGLKSFTESPSYRGKNNLNTCVDFRYTNSEGWNIKLKREFPLINYDNNEVSDIKNPVGFWHNPGIFPEDNKGVFYGLRSSTDNSLIDLCGFKDYQNDILITDKAENKVGELAEHKEVKEAILMIPYSESLISSSVEFAKTHKGYELDLSTEKKNLNFFSISEELLDKYRTDNTTSKTLKRMYSVLKDYNLPPELDFLNNPSVLPYVCYVAEIKHTLNRSDLSSIWQGRLPEIGVTPQDIKEDFDTLFEQDMTSDEFFEGKTIPEKTKFLIFKVKQKSLSRYDNEEYTYNWPYDYFSLTDSCTVGFEMILENLENV